MKIKDLTLISSADCNLQCSYCELNKCKNSQSHIMQQNTIEAFQNGNFLNNIKQIYQRLGTNPKLTKTLSLWGQEPTLTLDAFSTHLSEWLQFLPNINTIFFSTNGIAFTNSIINFVKLVDSLAQSKIDIQIQFSYDGEYSTNNIRNANDTLIINNVKKIINELNNYKFNKTKLQLNFNSVISFYLISQLNTTEKIAQYYEDIAKVSKEINSIIQNDNIKFLGAFNKFEFPVDATTDDGQIMALFTKRALQHAQNNTILSNYLNQEQIFYLLKENKMKSVQDYFTLVYKDKKTCDKFLEFLNNNVNGCASIYSNFKIDYSGTLYNCQTHIFDTNLDELYGETAIELLTKYNAIKQHKYINLLTDSIEDIEKQLYVYKTYTTESFISLIEHYMIMLNYMAAIGQIDKKYYNNPQLLLKHIMLLSRQINCPYANDLKTGSIFIFYPGFFRLYFNGLADIIERVINNELSKIE